MALLFADSFQHHSTSDHTKKWTTGAATIQPTSGRGGRGAMAMDIGGKTTLNLAAGTQTLILGCAYKLGSNLMDGIMLGFHQSTTYGGVEFRLRQDGSIAAYRIGTNGTTATLLGAGAADSFGQGFWTFLEFKATCSAAAGTVEVRSNGQTVLSLTSLNTDAAGTGLFAGLTIGTVGIGNAASGSYSDLYLCDATGTINTGFLGDCKVESLLPTSNGATQQFTAVPGGTHYTAIDETPMSTSDYLLGAAGQTELNGFADMTGTPAAIFGAQVVSGIAASDAGALSVRSAISSGGTTYTGSAVALTSSYRYIREVWQTDPATGAAWTAAGLNAAQVGLSVV